MASYVYGAWTGWPCLTRTTAALLEGLGDRAIALAAIVTLERRLLAAKPMCRLAVSSLPITTGSKCLSIAEEKEIVSVAATPCRWWFSRRRQLA